MLLMLSQIRMRLWPDFVIFMLLLLCVIEIVVLKIGLAITKAQERKSMRWVAISFFIQAGVLILIASPLILMGIGGAFDQGGPPVALIFLFIVLSLFIDLNVLNVMHRLGFKRALAVFGLMLIPLIIVIVIITSLFSQF